MGFFKKGTGRRAKKEGISKSLTNGACRLPIKEGLKAFKWPSGHRKRRDHNQALSATHLLLTLFAGGQ